MNTADLRLQRKSGPHKSTLGFYNQRVIVKMFAFSLTVWLVLSTGTSARISTAYKNYLDCSFESDCPLLTQDDTNDFDWKRGNLRVRDQGHYAPSADATFGNRSGWYLYTPSEGKFGSSARLTTVSIFVPVNTTVQVDFAYHMYDEESDDRLGSLKVYVCTELWSLSGNQGPSWVRMQLNTTCPKASFQVVFEGILGGRHSDIGIDDISIGFYQEVHEVWMMVAVVSIALVGCLALCLMLAVLYVSKLRKRSSASLPSSDRTSPKQTSGKLSDTYTAYNNGGKKELDDREYCELNDVGGVPKPETPVRYSSMYLQPKATLCKEKQAPHMRIHKLSWSNDAEDVDVYEAMDGKN